MKKYLIVCSIMIFILLVFDLCFFELGFFIDFQPDKEVTTFVTTEEKDILLDRGDGLDTFEIKGVDIGTGIPGHFATDYAIDKKTYLRWFKYIQEMGANTIRVYTILNDDFYNAFYEYNKDNDNPLYLLHGLWVNDYVQNSSKDAYDDGFRSQFLKDSKKLVDIIHGKKQITISNSTVGGTGFYFKDISPWVIGYILGVEWEEKTVAYTNDLSEERNSYSGEYMYTTPEATPFETMLTEVGDKIIEYESTRYKEQRLVAFSNWPLTDPFTYEFDATLSNTTKYASVDVEHIKTTDKCISGQFASYHIYTYFPDYLKYEKDAPTKSYVDEKGDVNTYRAYLKKVNDYHTIPVVVSEFGIPASRGMAHQDTNTGRNQGQMTEEEQGEAIKRDYEDIKAAGINNAIIFSWQDEWFKRTWNTLQGVDLLKVPYWSDYQTNEQSYGLLAFDPGKDRSVSYVDGDMEEWTKKDIVSTQSGVTVYNKYDEKFVYFRINKENYNGETLYLAIDTTPKSGSSSSEEYDVDFNRDADFLLIIDGKENSRLLVQERYNTLKATYGYELSFSNSYLNPPAKDSSKFEPINLLNKNAFQFTYTEEQLRKLIAEKKLKLTEEEFNQMLLPHITAPVIYETGKLRYGNANPDSADYDSLADFIINGDDIEIRLPWGLLNFSNPSEMKIHDDYYVRYGIEEIGINKMYVGAGGEGEKLELEPVNLKGWNTKVTYHERLKKSYYIVQNMWKGSDE